MFAKRLLLATISHAFSAFFSFFTSQDSAEHAVSHKINLFELRLLLLNALLEKFERAILLKSRKKEPLDSENASVLCEWSLKLAPILIELILLLLLISCR